MKRSGTWVKETRQPHSKIWKVLPKHVLECYRILSTWGLPEAQARLAYTSHPGFGNCLCLSLVSGLGNCLCPWLVSGSEKGQQAEEAQHHDSCFRLCSLASLVTVPCRGEGESHPDPQPSGSGINPEAMSEARRVYGAPDTSQTAEEASTSEEEADSASSDTSSSSETTQPGEHDSPSAAAKPT